MTVDQSLELLGSVLSRTGSGGIHWASYVGARDVRDTEALTRDLMVAEVREYRLLLGSLYGDGRQPFELLVLDRESSKIVLRLRSEPVGAETGPNPLNGVLKELFDSAQSQVGESGEGAVGRLLTILNDLE